MQVASKTICLHVVGMHKKATVASAQQGKAKREARAPRFTRAGRARARALSTRRFSRVSYIYCQLLELPKNFCGQNNSSSASVVGPEEEREPLGFRTFFNHHDVVMMMTRSAVLGTLSARVS